MPDITQRGQIKKDDSGVAAGWNYMTFTTATSGQIKGGPGVLHVVNINTPIASEVITIYDNTSGSGTKIATITYPGTLLSSGPNTVIYDAAAGTGLFLTKTSVTSEITVSYI